MNNFKIKLEDGKKLTLSENDLVNSGGEGKIYVQGDFAYKIYFDLKKVMPHGKIKELNILESSNIIKPIQVIYNENNEIIGYQMIALDQNKCFALTRFFTNDFRNQYGIDNDQVINIIKVLYATFEEIHNKGCLVVDGNEMNFLVSEDFSTIYFIDVDSYSTKNYPASAFNPTTLDPLTNKKNFNQDSDWYIFGILFCQIVLGIHPFKGKYVGKSIQINNRDIENRMEKGVSIFRKNIKLNKAVRDFSLIPSNMLNWLDDLFNNKVRSKPPLISIINDAKIFIDNQINPSLTTLLVESFNHKIDSLYYSNEFISIGNGNFNTKNKVLMDNSHEMINVNNNILFTKLIDRSVYLFDQVTMKKSVIFKDVDDIYVFDNQLYVYQYSKISSTQIIKRKDHYVAVIENTWPLYQYKKYDNIILSHQNNCYIAYYFHENKNSIINLKDIFSTKEKIIDIKGFDNYIITLTIENNNYLIKIFFVDEFSKNMKEIFSEKTNLPSIDFVFTGKVLVGKNNSESILVGYFEKNIFIKKEIRDTYILSKLYYLNKKVLYTSKNDVIQLSF
jgi:hypothetical protein